MRFGDVTSDYSGNAPGFDNPTAIFGDQSTNSADLPASWYTPAPVPQTLPTSQAGLPAASNSPAAAYPWLTPLANVATALIGAGAKVATNPKSTSYTVLPNGQVVPISQASGVASQAVMTPTYAYNASGQIVPSYAAPSLLSSISPNVLLIGGALALLMFMR